MGPAPRQAAAELPEDEAVALFMVALRGLLRDSKDGDGTYLWIGGRNPSDALLRRLQARWPKLRPASGMPADGYRADFTEVRRPGPGQADVRVESHHRGAGTWTVFHFAHKGDAWELTGISGEDAP